MTEDYKLKLFNYINNNYQEIAPASNYYQVEDMIELSFDEGGLEHSSLKYLMKDANGVENGLILYVDNIVDQGTGHHRSIYKLRKIDGTYIANIQYTTSGEELPETEAVYVEDDGTLFIKTATTSTTFPNRIMMLNNICNKINNNYIVKIRKSYNISNYYGDSTLYCTNIYKSLTEAKYILVGYEKLSSDTKRKVEIMECTINVGSENEYNLINNLTAVNGRLQIFDCFIKWNSDGEYRLKILINTNETSKYIREYIKDYTQTTLSQNAQMLETYANFTYCYTNHDDIIYGMHTTTGSSFNRIYAQVFTVSGGNIETYIILGIGTYPTSVIPDISAFSKLNVVDDEIYIMITDNDGTHLIILGITSYGSIDYKVQKNINLSNIAYGLSEVIVNKQYALTNIYSFNNTRTSSQVPQINTYTCLNQFVLKLGAAQNLNSFVPKVGILRNDSMIAFARELYNCIRQQNTITSTIDVPNLLLNDTTIIEEQLVAKANNTIDDNDMTINKNIYEELLVNFNDTYTIIDNNNNNGIVNTNGSAQLAKQFVDIISDPSTGYDKMMTKFRVVYGDGTTIVGDLPTPTIDQANKIATYKFVIGTEKFVNRIEMISFDETMIYQTITLNVEANKVYLIKQKVRVR